MHLARDVDHVASPRRSQPELLHARP